MEALVKIGLPSVFILLGLAFVIGSFGKIYKAKLARKWPQTRERIFALDCIENPGDDGDYWTEVKVDYEYIVKGRTYRSSAISFDYSTSTDSAYHQKIYEILNSKKKLKVYYNSAQPQEAVLSTSSSYIAILTILVGVFFAGIGAGILAGIVLEGTAFESFIFLLMFISIIGVSNNTKPDSLIRDLASS